MPQKEMPIINPSISSQSIFIVTVNGFEESEIIAVRFNKDEAVKIAMREFMNPKFETGATHFLQIEEWDFKGKWIATFQLNDNGELELHSIDTDEVKNVYEGI